jgi:hypothetical protein
LRSNRIRDIFALVVGVEKGSCTMAFRIREAAFGFGVCII